MYWSDTHLYRLTGAIFLALLCIAGLILSIIKIGIRSKRETQLIPLYFILILAQILYSENILGKNIDTNQKVLLNNLGLSIYVVLEELVLSAILFYSIKSAFIKKYLLVSSILFVVIAIISWNYFNIWLNSLTFISVTEMGFLFIPSAYYFYEIMKTTPTLNLNKEPTFWITTGILFLIVSLIPSYVVFQKLSSITRQILDFLGYTIILSLFIKALTCSQQTQIQK